MQNTEWFPLVDAKGDTIGKSSRQECHNGSKLLHPVVHLHLFNEKGELYLQKRAMTKDIQPGKWDTAVGGHVDYGETIEEALYREAREELGLITFIPHLITKYVFESEIEKELVHTFYAIYNDVINPDPEELEGGRFWTFDEITANKGKNVFTPNFEQEFEFVSAHFADHIDQLTT
ncbi:NUDIX domain-containing protein [Parabacteroides sp. PF5-9]|uniref:NUDIX hydrolase n=1 Tax=Parabacteroides sp. PF5-9 TaxID=1742404 RepID=UPI00247477AA|nr:NUDIX domain-containing protein [Parabacteroides sp. PF5-9]MDH6357706.1 isopentenyldiphosphate isomerase [Parabacteroides sp. PF5-9]